MSAVAKHFFVSINLIYIMTYKVVSSTYLFRLNGTYLLCAVWENNFLVLLFDLSKELCHQFNIA
jgi:hypothetical protein